MASSIGPVPKRALSAPSETAAGSAASPSPSSGSLRPASLLATDPAVATVTPAAWTGVGWASVTASGHQRAIPIEPTSRTLRHIAGATSAGPTTATTAGAIGEARKRRSVPVRTASRSARSVTTSTWRSTAPRASTAATPSASSAATTAGPSWPAVCGSHRHQSHSCGASTITTTWRSAGPTQVAACTSMARATDAAQAPPIATAAPGPTSTPTGASSKCPAAATTPASSAPGASPASATVQSTGPQPRLTRKASS